MNNLVIGNTSQLSYYFPDEYIKISSRNIPYDDYKDSFFDRIFICFAEQRTFIENDEKVFNEVNFDYTKEVIQFFKDKCNNIVWYSTSELWNNCNGPINLDMSYNYNYSPYIKSKEIITNYIKSHYPNVIILYPFNFNSIHRKDGFLFKKIFNSIIKGEKIEIGDTYFYRDVVHPLYVVYKSITTENNEIIGSGRLIHINDFIRKLYAHFELDYDELVTENINCNNLVKRKTYWLESRQCQYNCLLYDTIKEIEKFKK